MVWNLIGLPVPDYPGYPLDPPLRCDFDIKNLEVLFILPPFFLFFFLRSRFQGRFIRPLQLDKQLTNFLSPSSLELQKVKNSLMEMDEHSDFTERKLYQITSFFLTLDKIQSKSSTNSGDVLCSARVLPVPDLALYNATRYLSKWPNSSVSDVVKMVYPYDFLGLDATQEKALQELSRETSSELPLISENCDLLELMMRSHHMNQDICLVGNKGEGRLDVKSLQ